MKKFPFLKPPKGYRVKTSGIIRQGMKYFETYIRPAGWVPAAGVVGSQANEFPKGQVCEKIKRKVKRG